MSLRKSLYTHYNRNSSSTTSFLNYVDQGTGEKHWVRDWYDPPKVSKETNLLPKQQGGLMTRHTSGLITPMESTPQPQSSVSVSQSQTPQPVETYGFKVKTWVITDELVDRKDCQDDETDTFIPLSAHKYMAEDTTVKQSTGGESGLTEAEMKSAVGGPGVSNSLFSSSAAQEFKQNGESSVAVAATLDASATPAVAATSDASATPAVPAISDASATAASATAASATPASVTPASATPASATPASATPASATPASATPAVASSVNVTEKDIDGDVDMH
ncbi:hypothetical protein FOA43_003021 [Brettanomyces nanus]|uniref:Uncharacterized protein n=1 Tax=Eeniella nana TaxID=13502 RepID=A0A875S440_EENNA|nr:uncharacterized protein FOA43_003021 [Brettanomyces nanus]QPG75663.1 hypothetical protein FOA43_003021 [Brettanomyces nanus]